MRDQGSGARGQGTGRSFRIRPASMRPSSAAIDIARSVSVGETYSSRVAARSSVSSSISDPLANER